MFQQHNHNQNASLPSVISPGPVPFLLPLEQTQVSIDIVFIFTAFNSHTTFLYSTYEREIILYVSLSVRHTSFPLVQYKKQIILEFYFFIYLDLLK